MTNAGNIQQVSSNPQPDQAPDDHSLKHGWSALYWIVRKPMTTVGKLATHGNIDRLVYIKSLLVYLLPIVMLRLGFMMPNYIVLFSDKRDMQPVSDMIIFVVVDALCIPLLLAWLFYKLYPVVLHRIQLLFGGAATTSEIRVGFSWSLLWVQLGMAVVCIFWLFSPGMLDEPFASWRVVFTIIFLAFVVLSGFLVHVCMMARVLRLSFAPTLFAIATGAVMPLSVVYLLGLFIDRVTFLRWPWLLV